MATTSLAHGRRTAISRRMSSFPMRRGGTSQAPDRSTSPRRSPDSGRRVMADGMGPNIVRSEEHTSELQSLIRLSYAVFCLKTKEVIDTLHVGLNIGT